MSSTTSRIVVVPHPTHPSSDPSTTPSFPKFALLPPELRIRIWDYAQCYNHNRLVTIAYSPQRKCYTSTTRLPATLHTTRESRFLALKIYTLSFATLACGTPKIYFSPSTDILTLNWSRYRRNIEYMLPREFWRVECIQIKHSELLRYGTENLGFFHVLKKVYVLCDGDLEVGQMFGLEMDIPAGIIGKMAAGKGAQLECSRGIQDGLRCSRHWWFKEWNERVLREEKMKAEEKEGEEKKGLMRGRPIRWDHTLERCLNVTSTDEGRERERRRVVPLAEQYAAVWHNVSDIMRFH